MISKFIDAVIRTIKFKKRYLLGFSLLFIMAPVTLPAQMQPVGPGKGRFEKNQITGHFIKWDRKSTPLLVLRVHGAGRLQTFAEISSNGDFKIPLPEIPADGNYGTLTCGDPAKGRIVQVTDFSLLTDLPGFSSPGRWDRGYSVIGMATFADKYFSENIGKPGGKRANWLYSNVARIVEQRECNNANSFRLGKGWNAFTVVSGPSGGPHTFNPGLDDDLGWYWYAFPEDIAQTKSSKQVRDTDPGNKSNKSVTGASKLSVEWLAGEWNGVQVDVRFHLKLKQSGYVWIESVESGRKKTMEGNWSLTDGEFVLDIEEGELNFNIEKISETSFRLFGKAASSDIVFTRK